jgi:8-oxo-dGTP diphosphatase
VDVTASPAGSGARPIVGIGAVVMRGGRVLMGERRGAHGRGTWAFPGGHLEFGEDPAACAAREVLEETGLVVDEPMFLGITNDLFADPPRHYVTLYYACRPVDPSAEARACEPDKCAGWSWWPLDDLPSPLFGGVGSFAASVQSGAVRLPVSE